MRFFYLSVIVIVEAFSLYGCGIEPTTKGSTYRTFALLDFEGDDETTYDTAPMSKTPKVYAHPSVADDPVTGTARIYERNVMGQMGSFSIKLSGDGTLTNSRFVTSTGDEVRANEPSHSFVYEPTDARFRETSLFTNANKMMEWFVSLGFDPMNEQIGIGVNAVIGGSSNNALYIPGTQEGEMPTIRVGNGDGTTVANLSTDADVVSMELGHHVVYRKLKAVFGESLILHYALADFFVMIKNNDPCLARTICPASNTLCWQQSQCLRTAENTLLFDDPNLERPHLRSQVISGMLWDLKKSGQISNDELAKLVFDSVSYLDTDSDIRGFIQALQRADDQNFGGRHRGLITNKATSRRLL